MRRFKRMALGVSACTLALAGAGIGGATTVGAVEGLGGMTYQGTYADLPACEAAGAQLTDSPDFEHIDARCLVNANGLYDLYA